MSIEMKVIIFVIVSIGCVWFSRVSLFDVRSHGFYRFFAWESIAALILLNLGYWFYEPFSIQQFISWFLLTLSSFLVIYSIVLLVKAGKPDYRREDPSLLGIEKTTKLVTNGIYRYIRHPIYCSLILLAWGVYFKQFSVLSLSLSIIASFFLFLTAKKEEAENILFFGTAYIDYMKQSKMFIPFIY